MFSIQHLVAGVAALIGAGLILVPKEGVAVQAEDGGYRIQNLNNCEIDIFDKLQPKALITFLPDTTNDELLVQIRLDHDRHLYLDDDSGPCPNRTWSVDLTSSLVIYQIRYFDLDTDEPRVEVHRLGYGSDPYMLLSPRAVTILGQFDGDLANEVDARELPLGDCEGLGVSKIRADWKGATFVFTLAGVVP